MNRYFPELEKFRKEATERGDRYKKDNDLQVEARKFHQMLIERESAYNSFWCGVPVIQDPSQLVARQELIWELRPDCIIETGVAWGGSLMFSASMLAVLERCGLVSNPCVIGVDVEIRPHNRANIIRHPLSSLIRLVEGSSISDEVIQEIGKYIRDKSRALVILDSNHTHEHVLEELRLYQQFIKPGSYIIVDDTAIEDFDSGPCGPRPWGKGNSPKTAVAAFLAECPDFVIDREYENRLLLLSTPDGWLKRIN